MKNPPNFNPDDCEPVISQLKALGDQGDDGRFELTELKKKVAVGDQKELFDGYFDQVSINMYSVVMVAPASSLIETLQSDMVGIKCKPLYERKISEEFNISKHTAYARQPSAFCYGSAFFVKSKADNKKVVATAAHVVVGSQMNVADLRFIHGIVILDSGDFANMSVHKSQIYKPVQTSGVLPPSDYELFQNGRDWALIEVQPAYEQFTQPQIIPTIVKIQTDEIGQGDSLYAIGHGLGLPLKISFDGEVLPSPTYQYESGSHNDSFFESKLTLLGGNSGCPVFSAKTHELVGIYMRGVKKLHRIPGSMYFHIRNERDPYEGQECLCVHCASSFSRRLDSI